MNDNGTMWAEVEPAIDVSVRALCRRPYPGHPKGCPNWDKKPGCPPAAPLLQDMIDLTKPVYVIWNAFDFAGHVARMRARHPNWSWRQLACCRYWQPGARKQLRAVLREFLRAHRGLKLVSCPEAAGVNVTETMRRAGVKLEWPPRTVTYQVALAGQAVADN